MTKAKTVVAILFGGRSAEHEISVRSAATVYSALDQNRFDAVLVAIDREGRWQVLDDTGFASLTAQELPVVPAATNPVMVAPGVSPFRLFEGNSGRPCTPGIDVVFPVLHGTCGEDGTVQGLLELAAVPYVGADVLGSAIGMDKDVQKRLLREAGLPVVPFVTCHEWEWQHEGDAVLARILSLRPPWFVKPARLGSSIGVRLVRNRAELPAAIDAALAYGDKVVVEQGVDAREIECAVLGGAQPLASLPGEIRPRAEFYSYAAKYLDPEGAELVAPAPLEEATIERIQALARETFRCLECFGMARVDFFLERHSGELYVNEINTIPGFTSISMYPRLWGLSGISLAELITRLIELALARYQSRLEKRFAPEPSA
jgi:D-alanine-D-alanine ligase